MALTDGLVSYWKLNEASGTRVDSHGSNNLTELGTGGIPSATGVLSNGADFERSDQDRLRIASTSFSGLAFSTVCSFSFWVKFESLSTDNTFVGRWKGGGHLSYLIHYNDTLKDLYFRNSSTGSNNDAAFGDWTPSVGVWYHVVVTFDSGNCKFYINGSDVTNDGTTSLTSCYTPSTADFMLGNNEANTTLGFDGVMDEVGAWNRVLTSAEVTELYNSGNGLAYPFATPKFKQATVNASDVPATLTNYPAYVDLSRLGIATLAEAQSIRCYSDSAKTIELAREIVSATEMHVKIPSLTSTFVLYVDSDGARSDYAVTDTYGRNAVWSDYLVVLHLEENPTGSAPQMTDSTGRGNNGTTSGMVAGDIATAQIGKGFYGDQSNNQITLPTTDFVNLTSYSTTAWVQNHLASGASWVGGIYQASGAFNKLYWASPPTTADTCFYDRFSTTPSNPLLPSVGAGSGVWTHQCWNNNGTTRNWYLNGVNRASDSASVGTPSARTSEDEVGVGAVKYNSVLNNMVAQPDVDEFRITSTILSANWITTEYNNQSDEAGFWGTWTDVGGGANTTNFFGLY